MAAPGQHIGQRRPREHAAPIACMARANRFIIAVEQKGIAFIKNAIARHIGQHERFEEPGGVRHMPFCRRGIGHRLHTGIGIRQRRRQRHGQAARALQGGQQGRRIRYCGACVGGHAAGPFRSVSGSRPAPEFLGRRVTLATSQHKMQVRQPVEIVRHCCQIHFWAAWQWKRANVRQAREFRQKPAIRLAPKVCYAPMANAAQVAACEKPLLSQLNPVQA